MKKVFYILILFFQISVLVPQSLLSFYGSNILKDWKHDAGMNWEHLSIFNSEYLSQFQNDNQDYNFNSMIKSGLSSKGKLFFFGGGFLLKRKSIFAYLNINYNLHEMSQDIYDLKLNMYGENTHASGFGFQNNWVLFQFRTGNENWGAGDNIELALSDQSRSYNYFNLQSDYGRLRVKYIYGFLEKRNSINRYITARGIEWTNKKSLVIGFSETVVYSGQDRAFDISYLNPISSHLEIELNNRLNFLGNQNSNAVWQIHIDKLIKNSIRISVNYLLDEFVFDPEIELQKEHGKAFSARIGLSKPILKESYLTFFSSIIKVGTPTFRHSFGTNNFTHQGMPLGWYIGSDSQEIKAGIRIDKKNNFMSQISYGYIVSGEESILERAYDPYKDYQKGNFPSGESESIFYAKYKLKLLVFKNFFFVSDGGFYKAQRSNIGYTINYGFDYKFSM